MPTLRFLSQLIELNISPQLVIITLILALTSWRILKDARSRRYAYMLQGTHNKIGLPRSQSNLRNQASPTHRPQPGQPTKLQSLFIYPIKSCHGIELSRSKVLPSGLEFDRLFTFAQLREDGPEDKKENIWQFLTMRQLPLLANVRVDLWLPNQKEAESGGPGLIIVRFPWRDQGIRGIIQYLSTKLTRGLHSKLEKEFILPLDFPSDKDISAQGYEFANIKIWREVTNALNLEKAVPAELKEYIGCKYRLGLFRMDPSEQREVFRCAPRKEEAGYQVIVDFHDAYPLHLLSLSSLQEFETKVEKDQNLQHLDARRFRSNMIVSGAEEYEEETWRSIRFGSADMTASFDVSCRTVRCKMPNVDPDTGIRHRAEPDRALRKYREVDEGAPKNGCLGMQLCPMFTKEGSLETVVEVGMSLTVIQKGSHLYIAQ